MHTDKGSSKKLPGKCLCGAVAFEFLADEMTANACHCSQCRAWSGHYWASVNAPADTLKFKKGEENVGWYRASDYARRGFCKECGSSLFWHADKLDDHKHRIAVSAGVLPSATGVTLNEHIFVADKGDYYEIGDGLPQKDKY